MINMNSIYIISPNLITRTIEGELIIVPIGDGFSENQDDMFSLNPTGCAIWEKIDGKNKVQEIISALSLEYNAPVKTIEQDVCALLSLLEKKNMILKKSSLGNGVG